MPNYHLRFYLVGRQSELFRVVKEMPPLQRFTHSFTEIESAEIFKADDADAIFAYLEKENARETIEKLAKEKRKDVALIALADKDQIKLLEENLPEIADIWTLPMTEEEIRFRFSLLQQKFKREKDRENDFKQEKNHTLETIFTTVDCGIMTHTLDGLRVIDINPAALEILGYETKEELQADNFNFVAATVVEEDKPMLREAIRRLKPNGNSVSAEYRVRNKNGRLRYIMGSIKLIEENGGLFCQRFLLDCTARKLEEEHREWKHKQLVHALSADYNQVCYFDIKTGKGGPLRTHNCRYGVVDEIFNPSRSIQEDLERYVNLCVCEKDQEIMRKVVSPENLQEKLREQQTYIVNYRTNCAGNIHHFQLKAVKTDDWKKNAIVVLGFRNIDDEMRNEIEYRNLLEETLAQANQANKAKSMFLSNMSHDIRTPMNAIVGFTTLALNHIDNKEQTEEYLKKIMTSGNHLLNLINDVLDMSRIESGKLQLEETPHSLPDILNELCNIIQPDADAKHLELRKDVAVVNKNIYCDKLRLNQVLLNLLNNSVKYTKEGGKVNLQVTELLNAEPKYGSYEFKIKDTGIGMSEEFVTHIFEPFTRERNSTISGIQGTGLGMTITKSIVDMMNGSIEVKSIKGVGTEFIVRFTFRLYTEENENSVDSENRKDAAEKNETAKTRSGRILLAEDNELNLEIAVAILSEAGFNVETAENGQIALDMLQRAEPGYYKLILMDVQMPVMDGYEATRAIRALENPKLSAIPIIAMTANAFEEDKKEALRNGMNGHIAKPINVKTLFDMLDELLK